MRLKFHAFTTSISNIINHLNCAFDIPTMVDSDFWNYEWCIFITNVSTVNYKTATHMDSFGSISTNSSAW